MIFPKAELLPETMDIPGYEGRYYVRQDGTVWRRWKSKDTRLPGYRKGRSRKMHLTDLSGKIREVTMSTIMRRTYFKGMDPELVLSHVNGLEADWAIWNLKPITRSELGKKTYRTHHQKNVLKVDPETGEILAIYSSSREAGKANHMSYQTILDACNNRAVRRTGMGPDGYLYRWE